MKSSLGTDHFVHLRIIKYLKSNKEYFLKDVFTLNERYCFYPFLFHWLISKLPCRVINGQGYKKINLVIKISRIFLFNFFCLQFGLADDLLKGLLLNLVYLSFPFSYLKWNAINSGLSARGFGLLLGEAYLYSIYGYFIYDHYLFYLILCVLGILFYLSSQFSTQFFILSSLFFTVYLLDFRFILIPVFSAILYYLLFKKVAISYFYGQLNHKRNYVLFFLKTQFKYRKSFYRDFVYDFWIKLKKNPKQGIRYFVTNPFIEISYGYLYLILYLILKPLSFNNLSNLEIIVFSGVFCFVLTTFRFTRFLGEAQRYIQFTIPFITIAFVNSFSISLISLTIWVILIILMFYYCSHFRYQKLNKIDVVKWFFTVKNLLKTSDLIISNDTQLLKIFSANFQIISTDWTYYFKNKKEFQFNHPKSYTILSPEAIDHLNKKYNPSILVLNSELYNQKEKDFISNNFSLEKITEFENYNMYRIV